MEFPFSPLFLLSILKCSRKIMLLGCSWLHGFVFSLLVSKRIKLSWNLLLRACPEVASGKKIQTPVSGFPYEPLYGILKMGMPKKIEPGETEARRKRRRKKVDSDIDIRTFFKCSPSLFLRGKMNFFSF
jgi:hypothetical protein